MNLKRMAIMVVGGTVLFGGVIGFTQFRQKMIAEYFANLPVQVVTVTAEPVARESWRVSVPAVGTLRARSGVDVSPSVGGQVQAILFDSGRMVRKGDVLVQLDADEEESQLASARATANLAHITASRAQRLAQTAAGTRANLDEANAQVGVAEANIKEIQARIAKKTIRAPFSGRLGVRQVDLGAYVNAGQTLVNLQDLSVIMADFTVSQRDLALLSVGAGVELTTDSWPGRTFMGTITAIAPQIDANTGMVRVEARFDNPDDALRPGMLTHVEVIRPESQTVLSVPVSSVTYSLSGDAVFVLGPLPEGAPAGAEAAVERVVVALGERRGDRVAVASGLEDGQRIVTSGQMKLQNGSLVTIADVPLSAAAAAGAAR
ncbi:efflux RND transporter periplasmic adaptor subunit [Pararhodospirillum oryzae]|uniref:MexH family multidrug efflux RND transporter periplasmic adaptor subunit n=1 Tax=Pararhodospirillum oryzae TaxID=478448 RepID=A0A512H5N7_9PROT|nr:efflux RND transporter periplasmic adaptor subunit [Pararhodospirillum oryzae]GEO80748.1 MexH family multidrug efflux RND transporter periplasmic adaptor subunit [Pararhodospirillum oryzae]